ncbi:FMN reductase (NADPH) [Paenibacillus montaniterrae]|uniref:FMN reductase (NADPH) n=1 Tax=Paenibacillus montaniterrae TaxID=429341 RepID=A0A919YMU4_9BACL|nr:NADPH-dependent FMN reductase [Paenibacillus montaniterrae]GIP16135.1 FMN reductase (NADPH) [Paenibacillus montaniterrae]
MSRIVIINGANAASSRVNAVQQYIEKTIDEVASIEVFKLPAEDLLTANFNSEHIQAVNRIVEKAEAVVVLTPVYKAAYSGILKTYLDLLPQKGLEHKTILPIAVGGSLAHLLSLEYALKPVLSVLGATTILQPVYLIDKQIERLENGSFSIAEEAIERIDKELNRLAPVVSNPV